MPNEPTLSLEERRYQCRWLRHAWKIVSPEGFIHIGVWRNAIHLECLRCETVRHDGYDPRGELVARRYDYPDNYKMSKDEKPTTNELRVWALKRSRSAQRLKLKAANA